MTVTEARTPGEIQEKTAGTGRRRLGNWLAFGVLLVAAIIWLIPLAWASTQRSRPRPTPR